MRHCNIHIKAFRLSSTNCTRTVFHEAGMIICIFVKSLSHWIYLMFHLTQFGAIYVTYLQTFIEMSAMHYYAGVMMKPSLSFSLQTTHNLGAMMTLAERHSGLPRHRENREFGGPFFQTGKTQGICQKILKMHFYTGNLTPTQGKFGDERNNELVI